MVFDKLFKVLDKTLSWWADCKGKCHQIKYFFTDTVWEASKCSFKTIFHKKELKIPQPFDYIIPCDLTLYNPFIMCKVYILNIQLIVSNIISEFTKLNNGFWPKSGSLPITLPCWSTPPWMHRISCLMHTLHKRLLCIEVSKTESKTTIWCKGGKPI